MPQMPLPLEVSVEKKDCSEAKALCSGCTGLPTEIVVLVVPLEVVVVSIQL